MSPDDEALNERTAIQSEPLDVHEHGPSVPRSAAAKHVQLVAEPERRRPLDWQALAHRPIPARDWAIEYWLGMGHVTLLAGKGGVGKSLLAQQIGSNLALGRSYIDQVLIPRRVLLWNAEDEADELWRRQAAIAAQVDAGIANFADELTVEPLFGRDATLATLIHGTFMTTPLLEELREQVSDYAADVVILDNASNFFGGNENDRHQVTTFISAIAGACAARHCAVLLLGHTSRAPGSEFSGSTAWENAVRARLWFSDKLPDQAVDDDPEPASDVRYLSRRKANYTSHDVRTLRYHEGAFAVDQVEVRGGLVDSLRRDQAERVVLDALRKLSSMNVAATDGATSPNFLPRVVIDYKLNESLTKRELGDGMRRLMTDGKIKREQVGTYPNRTPRYGLKVA